MTFNLRKQNENYYIRYKDGIAYIYYGDAIYTPVTDCSGESAEIVYICSSYLYNPLLTVGWDSSYCNSNNTHTSILPLNNYLYPQIKNPPSDAYNYICGYNYRVSISNRIKITIVDDEIFNGTYVFDRVQSYLTYNWILNTELTSTNISVLNQQENQYNGSYLIKLDSIIDSNPYIEYKGYLETLATFNLENSSYDFESAFAFPANFIMTAIQPPCNPCEDNWPVSLPQGTGHRLVVGFNIPIRWRHSYNNWIVVDKITHNISGLSTNFASATFDTDNDNFKDSIYLDYTNYSAEDNNPFSLYYNAQSVTPVCTGLSELGFAFRASASGLGSSHGQGGDIAGFGSFVNNFVNNGGQGNPNALYDGAFYNSKVPVNATIDFVYSCRSGLPCLNLQGTSVPPSSVTGVGCLSLNSFIDIDYWCNEDKAFPTDYDWTGGVSKILSTQIIFSGVSGMNPLVISSYAGDANSYYTYDTYISYDEFPIINIPYTGYLPSQIRNFLTNKFHVVNFNENPYTNTWIPNSIHKQYPNLDLYWETDMDNQSAKVYVIADEGEYKSPTVIISGAGTSSANGTYYHIGSSYDIYSNMQYFKNLSNNNNFYIFLTNKGWAIQKFQGNAWVPYYRVSGVNILSNTYSRVPYYQINWSTGICLSGAAPAPISKSYY